MAVDTQTHLKDARTLPGKADNRGQLKRSWKAGVEDMQAAQGIRRPGLDRRYPDGLTWGDIGRMLGYILGPMDSAEQERLYERASAWGAENLAWRRTQTEA